MIRINANLFRLAFLTASDEETRYYLNGVFVMPHAVIGAVMVTTDGHRMMVIHDVNGIADRSAIIRLTPDALKLCKPQKQGFRSIEIQFEGEAKGSASIYDNFPTDSEIKASVAWPDRRELAGISVGNCVVDGTFPDWRRGVPVVDFAKPASASFNGEYIGEFGVIAKALYMTLPREDSKGKSKGSVISPCGLTIYTSDTGGPALIRFLGVDFAFGVLMPLRNPNPNDARLPFFLDHQPPAKVQPVAELEAA